MNNRRNMWIGLAVVIVIAAAIAFVLLHKSNKDNTPTSSSTNTANTTAPHSSTSSNAPNQPASSDIITTKSDPSAGQYLVGNTGKPLYTYSGDTTGKSNCTGACVASWPIYEALSSSSNLPTNVTIITRSDGQAQYAYKGMPLYYFVSDSDSTPTGNGVGGFNLAKP